jgi:hypothetical protein
VKLATAQDQTKEMWIRSAQSVVVLAEKLKLSDKETPFIKPKDCARLAKEKSLSFQKLINARTVRETKL